MGAVHTQRKAVVVQEAFPSDVIVVKVFHRQKKEKLLLAMLLQTTAGGKSGIPPGAVVNDM